MDDRGKKRPPPRWLNCPRKGFFIAEKFLPFKTPLDDSFKESVPPESEFTPEMMINSLSSYKVKMGLWIDLTNTSRFYNKQIIEGLGVRYLKLQCRGHGECPDKDQTSTFIRVCHRFIANNPLEVIGVHCTHGFNRTGFLIAAYLVEALSWGIDAAVKAFAQARPPGIYKSDYLKELFRQYGDVQDAPPAPLLPDWCNEVEDVDDEGNPLQKGDGSGDHRPIKRRKEFMKKNPVFMEGVPGVNVVTDPKTISNVQRKCQEMCGWNAFGFPGSQPVSMDIKNLEFLNHKPYKVSWKADGTRYMMLIDGPKNIFFIDRDNCVFHVRHLTFPRRKAPTEHMFNTLLDGEMIIDKVDGVEVPRYLVYDIIKFEGIDVGHTDFERRLLCINKEIVLTRRAAMEEGRIDRSGEPFSIRAKEFWDIHMSKQLLGEKFSKNMPHELDGLIFQPVPLPYIPGRCPEILKWKPANMNSVDFRLEIKKTGGEGIVPKKVGFLYVGKLDKPFGQIPLNKVLKDLDKKIIECKYENNQWVFMRERTDKSFPNSFDTAIGVCNSIKTPVTSEALFEYIEHHRWLPPITPKQTKT